MDDTTTPAETVAAPGGGLEYSRTMRDRLVRLAYRFLWNRDEAEEVVQEALLVAYRRAAKLRDRHKWWAWISRVVVNRCHEQGRRRLRRERQEAALRSVAYRGEDRPQADEGSTIKEVVRRSLPALSRRQHEVIVLRHLHGMSYDEVAAVLGITVTTARVHARAGREALRELLLERSPELFTRLVGDERRRKTDHEL